MAVSSLRRTKIPDGDWKDSLSTLSTEHLSLDSIEKDSATGLCEEYPFNNQIIYRGSLSYEEDAMWGTGRSLTLNFEFRTDSELFLLSTDVDISSYGNLIHEINSGTPSELRIYRNLTVGREYMWEFLERADRVINLSVLLDGEEKEIDEIGDLSREEIIRNQPIESASVVFTIENNEIVVRYKNGSLSVHSDWEKATEYVVQLFERDVIAKQDS